MISILLFMVLLNLAVRYPIFQYVPHGSDTYSNLDLARSLTEKEYALWTMSPTSYIGLFPLSYPSGAPFLYAEYEQLTDASWNSVPWAFSFFFATLMVLAGFLMFRTFRIGDEVSALLAGLMALSPFFMYFTVGQASSRGFLIPLFVLGLFVVFWHRDGKWSRFIIFSMVAFGALTLHRSSFVVLLSEGMACAVVFLMPIIPRLMRRGRLALYGGTVTGAALLFLWPWVPGLKEVLGSIPEVSSTFRMAEIEFSTGFLLQGDSLPALLMNLGTNTLGSVGLPLLVLPFGLLALYPSSRGTMEGDIFLLLTILAFSPFIWRAQYIQLILLPFVYIVAGVAIERRSKVIQIMRSALGFALRRKVILTSARPRRFVAAMVPAFVALSIVFSCVVYVHRATLADPFTAENNWPSESLVNIGNYIGSDDAGEWEQFVSGSGMVDRRIRWFSGWQSPVVDATTLQASGYLSATADDFTFGPERQVDYLTYLTSFYRSQDYYDLDASIANRDLYYLSWDILGFLRLYEVDPQSAMLAPKVSTDSARISIVVVLNHMGTDITNPFTASNTLTSNFLKEVTAQTYKIYDSDGYGAYLSAVPSTR